MEVLFVIVPLAVAFAGFGALAFVWAVCARQFDDLSTPAHRILIDDEAPVADRPSTR